MNEDLFNLFYQVSSISTDTRKIEQNSLFICLTGETFNGNTFAEQALKGGAKFVIVDQLEYQTSPNIYLVDNCLLFLQKLANHHRNQFSIPVVGITGSNGKTSSKELIKAVLSKKYNVLATEGNLNNHIGVPLTLLKITKEHQIAIIEMGANKYKDIEELCTIAEPSIGLITNIGKAHLEGFHNFEGVLKTKLELYQSLSKINGQIIINLDDSTLTSNVPAQITPHTYGQDSKANVRGTLLHLSPYVEMEWLHENYKSGPIKTQMIGKYNFYNFLAAIAFGIQFKVPPAQINEAISEYTPTNNRSQIKETSKNTVILDCYNANPTSMESALESFAMIDHPHKKFIVGDMLELGLESHEEHKNIIKLTKKLDLDGYFVGAIFKEVGDQQTNVFENTEVALNHFKTHQLHKHLILLKGSRGIGLEKMENVL